MSMLRGPLGSSLLCLLYLYLGPAAATPVAGEVFINEFHYDNAGADSGEFVELAGVAGTDLGGWRLTLYNGGNGLAYASFDLGGVLGDDTGAGFGIQLVDLLGRSVQNGAPDGMALVDSSGRVREFISYEGVLVGAGGPAAGLTSRDIGVAESGASPVGGSLALVGTGVAAADFTWRVLDLATPGVLNDGQQLGLQPAGRLPITVWPLWLLGLGWLARPAARR